MQRVDPDGALKMYMQSEEWDKCIQLAQELVSIIHVMPIHMKYIVCVQCTYTFECSVWVQSLDSGYLLFQVHVHVGSKINLIIYL